MSADRKTGIITELVTWGDLSQTEYKYHLSTIDPASIRLTKNKCYNERVKAYSDNMYYANFIGANGSAVLTSKSTNAPD